MANSITTSELNMRCAGVKRLLKEAQELRNPDELLYAKPMEDNLFEWHFTIRGPSDTAYQNGVYHGRIILPAEYPMKPPSLILLTPNGRFETNKKVCLSISNYHPETWLPSWSIRTALLALIGLMPTHSQGALGGLECSDDERRRLAAKSLQWRCDTCDCRMNEILSLMKESAGLSSKSYSSKNASITQITPTTEFPSSEEKVPANDGTSVVVNRKSTRSYGILSSMLAILSTRSSDSRPDVTVTLDTSTTTPIVPSDDANTASRNSVQSHTDEFRMTRRINRLRNWIILPMIIFLSAVFLALLNRRLSTH